MVLFRRTCSSPQVTYNNLLTRFLRAHEDQCRHNLSVVIAKLPQAFTVEEDKRVEEATEQKSARKIPKHWPKGVPLPEHRFVVPHRPAPAGIINEFLLESLAYKSMYDREDEVERAHANTFEWVFDDYSTDKTRRDPKLKEWLETETLGPIYWVTGKPGSGKSTFIQYLSQHAKTRQALSCWSTGREVCFAGFFFWTSGSREQRSQTGLLRSLLHQILTEHPEFIASAFPEIWDRVTNMTTKQRVQFKLDWKVDVLTRGFQELVKLVVAKDMKLCLFIDGLDEFEGDHNMIINLFKGISEDNGAEKVKLCLSSRPWKVFEDAFEYTVPNLKLQDVTYDDMSRFVSEKLKEDEKMATALDESPGLVDDAVRRADGVFLWVRLAVEQMKKHFADHQSAKMLENTLQSLPTELDDLFEKFIFVDQSMEAAGQTGVLYRLLRAREEVADFVKDDSANALTVWELAFAIWDEDDKTALNDMEIEQVSPEFVDAVCGKTMAHVKKYFAGLLGIQNRVFRGNMRRASFHGSKQSEDCNAAERRVFYIHRTVRDWLVTCPGVDERLRLLCSPEFDPHLRLLRSYVLRMKLPLEEIEHHRRLDDWWPDIVLALTHARYAAIKPWSMQRSLINELDKTIRWWWLDKPDDPYDNWARTAFGTYEVRMKAPPIWQPLLCLAVKFGLTQYVSEELDAREEAEKTHAVSDEQMEHECNDTTPLLAYAVEYLCSRKKTIYPMSDPDMIMVLLTRPSRTNPGANHEFKDFIYRTPRTAWIMVLRHLRDAHRLKYIRPYDVSADGTARWTKIVAAFLEKGKADAGAVVLKDMWDPEVSGRDLLKLLDESYCSSDIRRVRDMLESCL